MIDIKKMKIILRFWSLSVVTVTDLTEQLTVLSARIDDYCEVKYPD